MSSITSANAVIALSVPGLFDTPQVLQGFSADNIYDIDAIETAQTLMGVDGKLSGGFVFNPINQTIRLQADSDSCALFDQWRATQEQLEDALPCNATTTLKAVGSRWTQTKGFLVSASPMPAAGRVLQPRAFIIRWQSVQRSPIGS